MSKDKSDAEASMRNAAPQASRSSLRGRADGGREARGTKEERARTNEDLAHSLALLRATLDSTTDAILATDHSGNVTSINERYLRLWRIPEALADVPEHAKLLEAIAEQFVEPDKFINKINSIYQTSPRETFDVLETADGRTIERSSRIQSIGDRNVGRVWSFRDVSDRVAAEREMRAESRALELLNRTGRSIAAQLDLRTLVQTVTDAATNLSGAKFGSFFFNIEENNEDALMLYTLSGAPREAFEKLGHPRATGIFGPTFRGEAPIRSDDIRQDPRYGQWAPHHGMPEGHLPVRSYLAVPVVSRAGKVLGGLFFGHPEPAVFNERAERIVSGIAAQAAIAIDNARLYEAAQREIAQRLTAENALQDADRRKDEFLAVLAHELRNPLAPILQAARILKTPNATRDQVRWSHDVIDRQVRHMSLLMDDLLDVSRITRGRLKLRKEWADLRDIIETALETAGPIVSNRQHDLRLDLRDEPLHVLADPLRLAQILANLITNAAKYTNPRGAIRVSARRSDEQIIVEVADTGIGIDPEMLPQIFTMFSQTKSAVEHAEGGLGIGLALVKGLVELHDGRIEARSEPARQGSVFTVRLPVGEPPATSSPAADGDSKAGPATRRRILVADDNRDSADSLAMVLRLKGHTVDVAYDGEAAVSAFAKDTPEFVILDIGMPGIDGYEAARRIRAFASERARPVTLVALTGWGQESDKNRAAEAGFDHHFTKPVDTDRLLSLL